MQPLDSLSAAQRAALEQTLRLALVPGVGPRLRQALLEHFGSAQAVLAARVQELRAVPGVGARLSAQIALAAETIDAAAVVQQCRQHGIAILTPDDADYPARLREIADPPGVLFLRGQWQPAHDLAVAIVGTRHATVYGLQQAERLASGLARAGMTVVSGLARGIDQAAHRGALAAGGRTLAVLASGVLNIYPPEHRELAESITRQGALLAEAPPEASPRAGVFPQRNRLISGLSLGVVVVEAAQRSGALITARHAVEQGREVFAVPGQVDNRVARGCHRLIRDGARLVESVDDVLEELGPLPVPARGDDGQQVRHPAELQLNDVERRVLAAVSVAGTLIDDVVAASQLPTPQVLATLSMLEMRRLVRRTSGNRVQRL
jgi:DNA processing protein